MYSLLLVLSLDSLTTIVLVPNQTIRIQEIHPSTEFQRRKRWRTCVSIPCIKSEISEQREINMASDLRKFEVN